MERARIIISGGGTGGHIFPALSIADAIKRVAPDTEFLFVGAKGKMEMEKVPAAGYRIVGLPVAGLKRSLSISNLTLPFKVMESLTEAGKILKEFDPDVVVGVGGYASGPMLWRASSEGIPCLIQEQNSYAGVTNKILSKRAERICVAYNGMERFFPAEKIILTGNPIRANIRPYSIQEKRDARIELGMAPERPMLLVLGGSLGCGTLNRVMKNLCASIGKELPYQVLWQSGKGYRDGLNTFFSELEGGMISEGKRSYGEVTNSDFIFDMERAYAAADLVISRAGAGTISELCAAGKASILVPSPTVAEDHQTHNAMALVEKGAAVHIADCDADEKLVPAVSEIIGNSEKIAMMEKNILKLARPNAAAEIASEVLALIRRKDG